MLLRILLLLPFFLSLQHVGNASPERLGEALDKALYAATSEMHRADVAQPAADLDDLRSLRDQQARAGLIDSALLNALRVVYNAGFAINRQVMTNDWRVLSHLAHAAGDLSGAINAAKRMVLIANTTNDPVLAGNARLDLMDLLAEAQRGSEFHRAAQEALQMFGRAGDQIGETRVQYRQGDFLAGQGRAADALSVLHLALHHAGRLEDPGEVARIWFALASANARLGLWKDADHAYTQAITLAPYAPTSRPQLHGLKAAILEGLGDLKGALHHLQLRGMIKDSLFSVNRAERAMRLQVLFGFRELENDLGGLQQEHHAALATLAALRPKLRWTLAAAGALSAIVLLVLLNGARGRARFGKYRQHKRLAHAEIQQLGNQLSALEQDNKRLILALKQAEAKNIMAADGHACLGSTTYLVAQMLDVLADQPSEVATTVALDEMRKRLEVVDLTLHNISRSEQVGQLNLKAHLLALVAQLPGADGSNASLDVHLSCTDAPSLNEDLVPISLLFTELLRISLEQSTTSSGLRHVEFSIGRLGPHAVELLYAHGPSPGGNPGVNSGSINSSMLRAWVSMLGGTIRLLKGDTTTVQVSFTPRSALELRKAS
ncbi:MAG TPA: hypothetical protein PKD45_14650 [Flavobacteriales bacterium]|nr:hypothetical protein [Flavobacteriales bacterium]